jgi:hypothetical protein
MRRPYKLIVTDDPNRTLGECETRHHPTMLDAANAFAKHPAPYKQVIYDDGHLVRELNQREQQLLEDVCGMLGLDVEETTGSADKPDPAVRAGRLPQRRRGPRPLQAAREPGRKANRSVNDAFYGSKAWKMSRAAQLFAHPLCQYEDAGVQCGAIADSVHHIVPIEEGGARRDPQNLLSVCRPHHSVIHAQHNGGVGTGSR